MHDLSMLQPAKEFAQHDWDRSFHRVTNLLSSQSAQNALEWGGLKNAFRTHEPPA